MMDEIITTNGVFEVLADDRLVPVETRVLDSGDNEVAQVKAGDPIPKWIEKGIREGRYVACPAE